LSGNTHDKAGGRERRDLASRLTEQRNPRSARIDTMTALDLVRLINSEDRTVTDALAPELPAIAEAVEIVADRLRRGGRLFYVGAGTSGRLGVLDAAECPPTFGTDPEMIQGIIAGGYGALVRAKEGAEDDPKAGALDIADRGVGAADVVMGIATSGRTPYVRGALERARGLGAATLFLCCTPLSEGDIEAETIITPLVGPEIVTGSTRMKAGTATKLVLNMITTSVMVLLGKTYGNLMVDLQATCDKLRDRARRILVETTGVSYEEAGPIIQAAGGSVKLAIVMTRAGVSCDEAARMLADAGGSVARALQEE
jgi:N-acetylmuramic acid 6-phosphate etherase